jgi:hypothetical protein
MGDLPHFAGLCDSLDITGMAAGRFGIRHYVHPALEDMLRENDPDIDIAELLDAYVKERGAIEESTVGQIYSLLEGYNMGALQQSSRNVKHLGHQLRRLKAGTEWAKRITTDDRERGRDRHKRVKYTIHQRANA